MESYKPSFVSGNTSNGDDTLLTERERLDILLNLKAHKKDFADSDYCEILNDLQANILKSTGHKYTLYCFLTFKPGKKDLVINWLEKMPLTSALEQQKNDLKNNVINLLLSYEGCEYFLDSDNVHELFPLKDDNSIAFQEGLSKRCPKAFGGRNKNYVETSFEKPSHALILVAANDDDELEILKNLYFEPVKEKRKIGFRKLFKENIGFEKNGFEFEEVVEKDHYEIGMRNPPSKDGKSREWFGFKDGISNPYFFPEEELSKKLGFKPDNPSKLNTVLLKNPLAKKFGCGSFAVFIKLEQNQVAFNEIVKGLAKKNEMSDNPKLIAARLIGRYEDGTPLHESFNFPTTEKRDLNDFDFSNDKDGVVCPFNAHIRKANPRDSHEQERIVRRGKVYGHDNSIKKGILFLSYQSNLRSFEDIVNRGLYGYNYRNKNIGKDWLFYDTDELQSELDYTDKKIDKKPVKFRGGQYFFSPAISFIRENLGNYKE